MKSMASRTGKCQFCARDTAVLHDGWRLKNSSFAKLCEPCHAAYKDGTFCFKFHKHEDGWRPCDGCKMDLHCGCIMSLHLFEMNDKCGVTCKKCLEEEKLLASDPGSASQALNLADRLVLDNCSNVNENLAGEKNLADPGTLAPLNDDPKNVDDANIEGSVQLIQPPVPGLVYLFEKELTATDCNVKTGRFVVPRVHAQEFLPTMKNKVKKPIDIMDTEGQKWNFTMGWWISDSNRKCVISGTRACLRKMKWNENDKLRFYKQPSDGQLFMELVRAGTSASTAAADAGGSSETNENSST